MSSVFEFNNYKSYLAQALATSGSSRGARSRLAETLRCQSAFVSQVLNSHAHFSLEHAVTISDFLRHSTDERHFFLLLVHLGRAGTPSLQRYYLEQLEEIRRKRAQIAERIQVKRGLSTEDQMRYYSSWHYAAIHILLSVPEFKTQEAISRYLKLPSTRVAEILEFLVSVGLAAQNGSAFSIGATRIHLSADSPMISKHHTNWRMRCLDSFDAPMQEDLHYSSIISLSREDARKVREILLASLEKTEPILRESREEAVYCLAMDLFELGRASH